MYSGRHKIGLFWTNMETYCKNQAFWEQPDCNLCPGQARLLGLIVGKTAFRKPYRAKSSVMNYKHKKWKPLPPTDQQNNMLALRNTKY